MKPYLGEYVSRDEYRENRRKGRRRKLLSLHDDLESERQRNYLIVDVWRALKDRRLSYSDLGRAVGKSGSMISNYLLGLCTMPEVLAQYISTTLSVEYERIRKSFKIRS